MEVYKLRTNFDWDSLHGNPWDLSNAHIDLSMRCFPTRRLHIPLQYVQTDANNRAYSVGMEYHYHLFNRLAGTEHSFATNHALYYDFFYDDDDFEEMQQEQEDDFQYEWDSFHGEFYQRREEKRQQQQQQKKKKKKKAEGEREEGREGVSFSDHFLSADWFQQRQQQHRQTYGRVQREYEQEIYPALTLNASHDDNDAASAAVMTRRRIRRFDSGGAEVIVEDLADEVSGVANTYALDDSRLTEVEPMRTLHDDTQYRKLGTTGPLSMLLSLLVNGNVSLWERLVNMLDLKFVQGVFKFHIQKPLESDTLHQMFRDEASQRLYSRILAMSPTYILDSVNNGSYKLERSDTVMGIIRRMLNKLPQIVVMNYLSALFGRNKLSANVGFNTKLLTWTSKFIARRKFYFLKSLFNISRPLYLAASVVNPLHPEKNRIAGLSASIRGFSLQAKRLGRRNVVEFSKRGYWTPFSLTTRNSLLQIWRKKYEQEELMVLPPPPQFDSSLPLDMQLMNGRLANRAMNILHQLSKVFRYFIDLQLATLRHTWQHLYPFRWERYKSFALSRIFEQLYLLSMGCRSRIALEYSWRRDRSLNLLNGFRVPVEFTWGCDVFRVWVFLDLVSEYSAHTGQWSNQHTTTIAVTLFDVYTLFSFTLSLHPFYRKLLTWWRRIKDAISFGGKRAT